MPSTVEWLANLMFQGSRDGTSAGEAESLLGDQDKEKPTTTATTTIASPTKKAGQHQAGHDLILAWEALLNGSLICFPDYYWITTVVIGMNMSWSAEAGYLTPTFLSMGLSLSGAGRAWTVGSVCIVLFMPFIAARSDVCTHPWGRRRIFILWGIVFSIAGLLLISNAQDLGYACGDSSSSEPWGITLGVLGVLLLQVALDCIYMTQRALVADTVQSHDVGYANAAMTFNNGVGRVLGFGLGSLDLVDSVVLSYMGTNVRALFTLCGVVLIISGAPNLLMVQETPYVLPGDGKAAPGFIDTWKSVYEGCRHTPTPIWRAAIVQILNYAGWAIWFYYGTDWFGSTIYGGDSDEDSDTYYLYEEGLQMANLGFLLLSMVNVMVSIPMEMVAEKIGIRMLWSFVLAMSAVLFIATWWVPQGGVGAGLAIFSLLGVPFAAMNELPWIIVTASVLGSPRAGLISTLFRMAEVLPYIIVGFASGLLDYFNDDVRVAFIGSGILVGMAALLGPWLLMNVDEIEVVAEEEQEEEEEEGGAQGEEEGWGLSTSTPADGSQDQLIEKDRLLAPPAPSAGPESGPMGGGTEAGK